MTDPARLDTQGSEEVPDDRDPVAVALRWLIAGVVAGAFVLGFLAGRDGGLW